MFTSSLASAMTILINCFYCEVILWQRDAGSYEYNSTCIWGYLKVGTWLYKTKGYGGIVSGIWVWSLGTKYTLITYIANMEVYVQDVLSTAKSTTFFTLMYATVSPSTALSGIPMCSSESNLGGLSLTSRTVTYKIRSKHYSCDLNTQRYFPFVYSTKKAAIIKFYNNFLTLVDRASG